MPEKTTEKSMQHDPNDSRPCHLENSRGHNKHKRHVSTWCSSRLNCSLPLFNIFIGPLAQNVHSAIPVENRIPHHALLTDDVIIYVNELQTLQRLLVVCTEWETQYGKQWNTNKSQVFLAEDTPINTNLSLSNQFFNLVRSAPYLCVTLSSRGIKADMMEARVQKSQEILTNLRTTNVVSSRINPKVLAIMFSTFVRSKFLYSTHPVPARINSSEPQNTRANETTITPGNKTQH